MGKNSDFQGPLKGLNVIDFGHYYAGPMAGMLLGDQGANVIRIVKPGKRELPEQQYRLLNRNKKLLPLDLKNSADKKQALLLIEKADVLIENFRPGVMKRLGLDYASVKDGNPGLIYLSLPGFASTDKDRAHIQAWEGVLGAASGLFKNISFVRALLNFPPLYTSVPVNSMYGGVHGVIAVMAALLAREQSGQGTVIETSLAEVGMTGFGIKFFSAGTISPDLGRTLRGIKTDAADELWLSQKENWFSDSDSPDVQLQKLSRAMRAFIGSPIYAHPYRCADGRQVEVCVYGKEMTERFLCGLGIYQRLLKEGFSNEGPWETELDNNISGRLCPERKQRLTQVITETFLTRDAQYWEELLSESVLLAMHRTREEWLSLEPMKVSGVFVDMDNGKTVLRTPGRFVDVSGPGETLIEEYREFESIGLARAQILFQRRNSAGNQSGCSPQQKGELLSGMKVLDLSGGVAGPMAAYLLAQYGAEVIKLDRTNPPINMQTTMLEVNQGKRSILADIKTQGGREVFRRLVSNADVVIHNNLNNVAERLGMRHEQLRAINPRVISCQVSAFGGTYPGKWDLRLGVDPIAQTVTGLMTHFGSQEYPQDYEGSMIADSMCGYGAAVACLLAVWQQRKTGYAGEARTSLVRASNFMQLPYMIAENGQSDWGEAGGQFTLGETWYQRIYACSDGWIYVSAREEDADHLAETVVGEMFMDQKTLEILFAEQSCAYWLDRLDAANITCHRVLGVNDICNQRIRRVTARPSNETALGAGEVLCCEDHPSGMPVITQAPDWVRIGGEKTWRKLSPCPAYGQDSQEILRELGYSQAEISHLINLKVIQEYVSAMKARGIYFLDPVDSI